MRSAARLALAATALAASPPAPAQVIDAFPPSLPGYENDYLLLPLQDDDGTNPATHGIRLADFLVYPALTERGGYDRNPYGVSGQGSAVDETRASLQASSDWRRDALDGALTLDNTDYPGHALYAQTDWTGALGGTLDLGQGHADLAYAHLALNLDPQQLGTIGVIAPIPYNDDDVRTDADLVLGRIRLVPALEFQTLHFDGGTPTPTTASFGALDRKELAETLTGLFELSKGRSLVALVRDTQADYRHLQGVPDGDYDDLLAAAGLDYQADAPIRLRAVAGGERRATRADGTITTPYLEASILWEPTRLTDITLTFRRRLADAADVTAGTEILTEGRLEIDQALHHDVRLTVYADIGSSDYGAGDDPGPTQLIEQYGALAWWSLSRHVALSLAYDYQHEDEGAGALDGTSHTVTLGLRLQG